MKKIFMLFVVSGVLFAEVQQVTIKVRENDGDTYFNLDTAVAMLADTSEAICINNFSYFTLVAESFGHSSADSVAYNIVVEEKLSKTSNWFFPNIHGSGADSCIIDTERVASVARVLTLVMADSLRFIINTSTDSCTAASGNSGNIRLFLKMSQW